MTTFESYKKFGINTSGLLGLALSGMGVIFILIGSAFMIIDRLDSTSGMEGFALFLPLGVIVAGLAMVLFGLRAYRKEKKRIDGLKEAYESGHCVMADIIGVRESISKRRVTNIFGTETYARKQFTIECHGLDPVTGKAHVYFSRAFNYDPTDMITGRQAPVYIDRNNEKNFFLDIDKALAPVEIHH